VYAEHYKNKERLSMRLQHYRTWSRSVQKNRIVPECHITILHFGHSVVPYMQHLSQHLHTVIQRMSGNLFSSQMQYVSQSVQLALLASRPQILPFFKLSFQVKLKIGRSPHHLWKRSAADFTCRHILWFMQRYYITDAQRKPLRMSGAPRASKGGADGWQQTLSHVIDRILRRHLKSLNFTF